MSAMPQEPEAFAERVADMLRRLHPGHQVQFIGPGELIINGRRLDLENLHRMVNQEPDRGAEIVEHYLSHLLASEADQLGSITLDFARPRVMPRIQPESIFEHLNRDLVAYVPFVNDAVVVFVIDMPQMTVSITTEQMIRWKLDADELDLIARDNLDRYVPEPEIQIVESKEGGRAAIIAEQDGYDAARLLMGNLHQRLRVRLGGDFYVAIPARDMFVALSVDPRSFVTRMHQRVEHDYRRLPYPITSDLFYVTRDGVAGTRLSEAA